eukprot:g8505.t1
MDVFQSNFMQKHSMSTKELKGEDVAFVFEDVSIGDLNWSIYCICDGHGGVSAAHFVRGAILNLLQEHLPMRVHDVQQKAKSAEEREWANKVAKATATVFCSLDEAFAATRTPSGTTISLALVCGSLLTIANVGDSEVFMDTGQDIIPMTECHKVETNPLEQTRLRNAGATLSSCLSTYMSSLPPAQRPPLCTLYSAIGPLRVWPGGIAVSRSLGDFECSKHVISNAHVKQVILPKAGARVIMATDGLWDHVSGKKACKLSRTSPVSRTPTRLFRALMSVTRNCLVDDTTFLIVDILPNDADYDFPTLCKRKKSKRNVWSKLKFILNRASILKNNKESKVYSSLDTAVAFPTIISRGHSIYHDAKAHYGDGISMAPSSSCERRVGLYNEETNRWVPERNDMIEVPALD